MSIWAHTLVKNEEKYIWFAVTSVINYVDKILIWDTGSTDTTVEIISEIIKAYPDKVEFKEVGEVDINKFTVIRQKMLDATASDWFMVLDGDEIWWDQTISEVVDLIKKTGNELDSVVNRNFNVVGDIYHHQKESAGMYQIGKLRGHINIRFMNRKIAGIHFAKPHGQQGVFDKKKVLIQNRNKEKRFVIEKPSYLHFTNMHRSSTSSKDLSVPKRGLKYKYDLGTPFPLDFYYPEVFFRPRPDIVSSPWINRSFGYILKSSYYFPLRIAKNNLHSHKSGY